ncbi:hypothetical protein GDO81_004672 [Engystomops pustulosus]|uniref:Uncharacterized protein n=1 Tax=Engystomops pustulosus TaxID=76066 RepID=A0AAV7CIF0_ENGPU|nr:hypothetical protein GDO81_004672 [Engystomops pustulosus]
MNSGTTKSKTKRATHKIDRTKHNPVYRHFQSPVYESGIRGLCSLLHYTDTGNTLHIYLAFVQENKAPHTRRRFITLLLCVRYPFM